MDSRVVVGGGLWEGQVRCASCAIDTTDEASQITRHTRIGIADTVNGSHPTQTSPSLCGYLVSSQGDHLPLAGTTVPVGRYSRVARDPGYSIYYEPRMRMEQVQKDLSSGELNPGRA